MHWKLKAKIQNAISLLPTYTSYSVYYWIQRTFGGERRPNPISRLTAGIEIWKLIQKQDYITTGKVFLEVGTGSVPLIPLAYWLMGAEKTISIDINPYLRKELITENLCYISENEDKILNLFGSLVDKKRFETLLKFGRKSQFTIPEFLELCRVDYLAPGDASDTHLPNQCVDFHTSFMVFEHIPPDVLRKILEEGNRILKNKSLFIHRIDYGDHFSYSDQSISEINFLKYSDEEWERYAGNRYMYMNRLRHDDFINLFESVEHSIVKIKPYIDQRSQELLRTGNLRLDKRFSSKAEEILTILGAWIITNKNG